MLRRYAPTLQWPVYFATEVPNHPIAMELKEKYQVNILPLPSDKDGFLESRQTALQLLPSEVLYVLPLQEDFLLDRTPDIPSLLDALFILDTDRHVSSLRLMPCPGPQASDVSYVKEKPWKILGSENILMFTYQATLWRRLDLNIYLERLLHSVERDFQNKSESDVKYLALTSNVGENNYGQKIFRESLPDTLHLCWPRAHQSPNAVYLCPWPYRPTAVVRGNLQPFAEELFQREGVKFERPKGNMMS